MEPRRFYPHHHVNPNLNRYGRPRHEPDGPVPDSHLAPDQSDMPRDRLSPLRFFETCPQPGCRAVIC